MGLMTADAPRFPVSVAGGNAALEGHFQKMGLKYEKTHGSYGGPEESYVVHGPTREQMHQLGHAFGQEAIVYSQNGNHELHYTHGENKGKYHPSFPGVNYHGNTQPEDYYTHLPGHGYFTLNFNFDKLHDSPVKHTIQTNDPAHPVHALVSKAEIKKALASLIKSAIAPSSKHPNSYAWHEGHISYHQRTVGHGVLLTEKEFAAKAHLAKSELRKDAATPSVPKVTSPGAEPAHATNEQAAGKGVSTYKQFALPYGNVEPTKPSSLKFYPMNGKADAVNGLVAQHGYQVHYAGGKHGKPDLANKNFDSGHLMIWDPSPDSGSSFGEHEYTDNWRKLHELGHALTLKDLNTKYGEGRRMGGLGKQRTLREAKRSVEWEHLAAHKQRELASQIGIHISDDDFHRELNTVMHDAVHRAITGKFTEPGDEGFQPHAHKVPLEHAMKTLDDHAAMMGLTDHNQLMKKREIALALTDLLKSVIERNRR